MQFSAIQTKINISSPKGPAERKLIGQALQLKGEVDSARAAVNSGPSESLTLSRDEGNFATFEGKLGSSSFNKAVVDKPTSQMRLSALAEDGSVAKEVVSQQHEVKSTGLRAGLHAASRVTSEIAGGAMSGLGLSLLKAGSGPGTKLGNAATWLLDRGHKVSDSGRSLEFSPNKTVERFRVSGAKGGNEETYEFHPNGILVHTDLVPKR